MIPIIQPRIQNLPWDKQSISDSDQPTQYQSDISTLGMIHTFISCFVVRGVTKLRQVILLKKGIVVRSMSTIQPSCLGQKHWSRMTDFHWSVDIELDKVWCRINLLYGWYWTNIWYQLWIGKILETIVLICSHARTHGWTGVRTLTPLAASGITCGSSSCSWTVWRVDCRDQRFSRHLSQCFASSLTSLPQQVDVCSIDLQCTKQ